jgi:hypothetical protein
LLRTVYQQDESPIAGHSSKRSSVPRIESSDLSESDSGEQAPLSPSSAYLHRSSRLVSNIPDEEIVTDDEAPETIDENDDGWTPELRKWVKEAAVKLQQKSVPRLKLDTADSVVNQINHGSPIRTTPRRQKSVM